MLEQSGADWLHFDVMDGHFVPNISFGPVVLSAIRPLTALPVDVHLMVSRPADWIDPFLDAGADVITLHVEAEAHTLRQLQRIRDAGKKAGLVLNPGTPVSALECALEYCDMVLLMSVNPGFGGQKFIPAMQEKLRRVRSMVGDRPIDIQVDGGIAIDTIAMPAAAGANVFVAGSAIFGGGHVDAYRKTINTLRSNAEGARA
jgi:ribulose-phosphate 3-epimerase